MIHVENDNFPHFVLAHTERIITDYIKRALSTEEYVLGMIADRTSVSLLHRFKLVFIPQLFSYLVNSSRRPLIGHVKQRSILRLLIGYG